MLGEKVACATVSPHLYMYCYACQCGIYLRELKGVLTEQILLCNGVSDFCLIFLEDGLIDQLVT